MGFYVKKDDLRQVRSTVRTQFSEWNEKLNQIEETLKGICGLDSFQGSAAQSVKCYLSEIHMLVLTGIRTALTDYHTVMTLYVDGYEEIDSGLHTILKEDTLTDACGDYQAGRWSLEQVQTSLKAQINRISDLLFLYAPSVSELEDNYNEISDKINRLISDVASHEQTFINGDISQLRTVIQKTREYLQTLQSTAGDYPVSYHSGDFQYDAHVSEFVAALQAGGEYLESRSDRLERAFENEKAVQEALDAETAQAREDRGKLQIVIGVGVVIANVGVIVATFGMAAPASFAVTAAVFGGMGTMYGLSEVSEGVEDTIYGYYGDITSVAVNPIRDTIFMGNQGVYDAWGNISTTVASLCVPAAAGWQAAKVGGKQALFEMGRKMAKDKIIDMASDTIAQYSVDLLDQDGEMKEYQKEALRLGASKIISKGFEKVSDRLEGKTFRNDMDKTEQKRYDEYWIEKARQRDSGEGYHPNDLDADELRRMRTAEGRLSQIIIHDQILEDQQRFWNNSRIITDGSHYRDGKLLPNIKYRAGENQYLYQTNSEGLIIHAEAEKLKFKNHQGRIKHDSKSYGKKKGDHAGHIFADWFGGSEKLDNIVSQSREVNQKKFARLERKWAKALENGQAVSVTVDLTYPPGSSRPSAFDITYTIDGIPFREHIVN